MDGLCCTEATRLRSLCDPHLPGKHRTGGQSGGVARGCGGGSDWRGVRGPICGQIAGPVPAPAWTHRPAHPGAGVQTWHGLHAQDRSGIYIAGWVGGAGLSLVIGTRPPMGGSWAGPVCMQGCSSWLGAEMSGPVFTSHSSSKETACKNHTGIGWKSSWQPKSKQVDTWVRVVLGHNWRWKKCWLLCFVRRAHAPEECSQPCILSLTLSWPQPDLGKHPTAGVPPAASGKGSACCERPNLKGGGQFEECTWQASTPVAPTASVNPQEQIRVWFVTWASSLETSPKVWSEQMRQNKGCEGYCERNPCLHWTYLCDIFSRRDLGFKSWLQLW